MAKKKRKQAESLPVSSHDLLQLFKEEKRPLKLHDFFRLLGISKRYRNALEDALDELRAKGRILQLRGGSWGLAEQLKMVTGILELQRSGVGFVLPEDKRRADIFISPAQMGDAWHGDKVVVALLSERAGRKPEGRIVRVLERGHELVPVRVVKLMGKAGVLAQPTDTRLRFSMLVNRGELESKPRKNELLLVEPGKRLEPSLWAGVAVESLGVEDDVSTQEMLVKLNHNVPTEFPAEAIAEAKKLPDVPSEVDFTDRIDLRHMGFVTIDGAKARDFDDAVYVEEQHDGWRLWVAIADVSHYVRPGSALDEEAVTRANSYYFPQSVEPMFPEALSNGLCSLNPRVPRLAMVAEVYFYADGTPGKSKFYPAVIESKARLTYGQVNRAVLLKEPHERKLLGPVLPMLEQAEQLARVLKGHRRAQGSLDFDLPEPEIVFNVYGEAVDIGRRVRHFGHQIIEEFMIAANEAVARFLTEKEADFLYRVHPAPDLDKLEKFFDLMRGTTLAHKVPAEAGAAQLQTLLHAAEGTDQEFLVNRMALRTMMQARYTPDFEGHFGLASDCYCHFTSPIRRYADLVVHRALKHALGVKGATPPPRSRSLLRIGDQLNIRERAGMEAEREILKRITVLFMRDRVGEEFTGVISGVADFGFWVELKEIMAEGLVRLSLLHDDYYEFVPERQELMGERTGRIFKLGQSVKVRLASVNVPRLEIDFELLEYPETGNDVAVFETGARNRRNDKGDRHGREDRGHRGYGAERNRHSRNGGPRNDKTRADEPRYEKSGMTVAAQARAAEQRLRAEGKDAADHEDFLPPEHTRGGDVAPQGKAHCTESEELLIRNEDGALVLDEDVFDDIPQQRLPKRGGHSRNEAGAATKNGSAKPAGKKTGGRKTGGKKASGTKSTTRKAGNKR
ncbi:ribonuclease R [Oleidesulfovibrio sp.]|uniref:ribonuclease R n=1 Tax=Oleidesulfovibrio sp. TaxID=2909707 RepID=UPI003A84E85B